MAGCVVAVPVLMEQGCRNSSCAASGAISYWAYQGSWYSWSEPSEVVCPSVNMARGAFIVDRSKYFPPVCTESSSISKLMNFPAENGDDDAVAYMNAAKDDFLKTHANYSDHPDSKFAFLCSDPEAGYEDGLHATARNFVIHMILSVLFIPLAFPVLSVLLMLGLILRCEDPCVLFR